MGTTPSGSTMATTTTTAPSLHFKIHAYQDLGNRPWVHEHYTVEVPATATLREALALFRANGASSWMGDYELVEHLGLYGVSPPPAEAPAFPGLQRPAMPDNVLDKNAVECGLREHDSQITFS